MNVLFDLGNVVINWDTQSVVDSLDLPTSHKSEMKRELFDHQDWSNLDHGLVSEPEVVTRIQERTNFDADTINAALDAARRSLTTISESLVLMYEIKAAGLPIYCLSNMSIETYGYIKDRMEFFECFTGVIISGHEKCMKPSPEIYKLTLDRFSLNASETFFIDDSEANVAAARKSGIESYLFKRTDNCLQTSTETLCYKPLFYFFHG